MRNFLEEWGAELSDFDNIVSSVVSPPAAALTGTIKGDKDRGICGCEGTCLGKPRILTGTTFKIHAWLIPKLDERPAKRSRPGQTEHSASKLAKSMPRGGGSADQPQVVCSKAITKSCKARAGKLSVLADRASELR
jgi:hypothetical protein